MQRGLRDEGGARVAPPTPATRRLFYRAGPRRGGRKKSDKTMERNLNYAPRKMAIVCKAMLIQRSRKRGGADFADAAVLPRSVHPPPLLSLFFSVVPRSLLILSPFLARRRVAAHLARRFHTRLAFVVTRYAHGRMFIRCNQ